MKLLVCLITYNRLAYSQRTLSSFLASIEVPYYLVAVDNASSDGTQAWLQAEKKRGNIDHLILNKQNFYPGKACNLGWQAGLRKYSSATHFMRLDNDMVFFAGWSKKIQKYFDKVPDLGLLGYDYIPPASIKEGVFTWHPYGTGLGYRFQSVTRVNGVKLVIWPGSVGGPSIIKREVWDKGIRYDESRWLDDGGTDHVSIQEDAKLCMAIFDAGYKYGSAGEKLAKTFAQVSNWNEYPGYYLTTLTERGYNRFYPDIVQSLREQEKHEK